MPDINYDIKPAVVYDYDKRKTNAFLDDYIQRYNKFHGGNYTNQIKSAFQGGRYKFENLNQAFGGFTNRNNGNITISKKVFTPNDNLYFDEEMPDLARPSLNHEFSHRLRRSRFLGGLGKSRKEKQLIKDAYNVNLKGVNIFNRLFAPITGLKLDEGFSINTEARTRLKEIADKKGMSLDEFVNNISANELMGVLKHLPYLDTTKGNYFKKSYNVDDSDTWNPDKISAIKRAIIEVAKNGTKFQKPITKRKCQIYYQKD